MKVLSVDGRNWWSWILDAASTSCFAGISRRAESFSGPEREAGMLSASRSWVNCFWASAGYLGCTPGPLDQIQACLIMEAESGSRRS